MLYDTRTEQAKENGDCDGCKYLPICKVIGEMDELSSSETEIIQSGFCPDAQ